MVAQVDSVGKGRQCSGAEEYFCRLIAYEGRKPTQAYRMAWRGHKDSAHDLAPRVMARPHVQARIAEMREAANREGLMQMAERRALLADIARRKIKAAPSHGERIAAIREDATLAGERNEQVSISGEVSVRACLLALSLDGSSLTAGASPAGPQMSGEGEGSPSGSQALAAPCEASPLDVVAEVVPPAGPVGGEYEE